MLGWEKHIEQKPAPVGRILVQELVKKISNRYYCLLILASRRGGVPTKYNHPISNLHGPKRHAANLDVLPFSINKRAPTDAEGSEYFPQPISNPLTIHTCPSCRESKKHSTDTQRISSRRHGKTSKFGSQNLPLNTINHVTLHLFKVGRFAFRRVENEPMKATAR